MATVLQDMHSTEVKPDFQAWSFEKAMLEAQQHSPSESSSADFFDAEERMRIAPSIDELKRTIEEQKSPVFNERYMSSEEALSPTDLDGEDSDADSISVYEAETAVPQKVGTFAMAVAICIFSVGKPKVVNLTVPSFTTSPSVGSESSIPIRTDSIRPPPLSFDRIPVLQERSPKRPTVHTQHSATSFAQLSIPKAEEPVSVAFASESNQPASPLHRSYTEQTPYNGRPQLQSSYSALKAAPTFLSQDPFADSPPPRLPHSRFRNLSQKFSRFAMYGPQKDGAESPVDPPATKLRKVSTAGLRRSSIQRQEPETPVTPDASPAHKRKMIPRGAAERAPAPQIPPCPYEFNDDGELVVNERIKMRRRKSLMGF